MKGGKCYVIFFFATIILSSINIIRGSVKNDYGDSYESMQSFSCDVCQHAVVLCEKNYDDSYNVILLQMTQYCYNLGRYASNCQSITQQYLLNIYSSVHNTNIKNGQICMRDDLCSDDDDDNNGNYGFRKN
uniref:Saposin B-type domain-containing protein n=1 Tax=Parastrongyloides trichosuri TaxID=131310 RepID=A0A0N4ZCF0_PARTI